jgi:hypothetical protein
LQELPEKKGVLLQEPEYVGPHTLCRAGCKRLPALGEALLEERDSVHGQLAILAREVDAAVAVRAVSRALQPFLFLEEVLQEPRVHSEIENAVAISFVVPQVLRESSAGTQVLTEAARVAPRVHAILVAQEEHERWQ